MDPSERQAEVDALRREVVAWAERSPEVRAVLLVGSWARDAARPDSDVDVVVLTESSRFVTTTDWIADVVGPDAHLTRTADWGALVERRVALPTGLEVEFGFAAPSWASTEPVDDGTRRVVTDGCAVWSDPDGLLADLLTALDIAETDPPVTYGWRAPFTNDEIHALHAAAFETRLFGESEWDWVDQTTSHSLGWVVARVGDRFVGFVNVAWDGLVHAFIEDVMVDADVRHRGIGIGLVHAARDGATAAGCEYLHVGFPEELRAFYVDACGFEPTGGGLMELG